MSNIYFYILFSYNKESAHNRYIFNIAVLIEWNKFDIDLRSCKSISSFKTLLKTHLFIIAYDLYSICCYLMYHEHILPCYYKHVY